MAVLSHAQLEALWIAEGGFRPAADIAAAIAQAESGGDTSRINNTAHPNLPGYHPPAPGNLPEYSVGLWQINELAHPSYPTQTLLSAKGNATAAIDISRGGQSWSQWSTYTSGAYKQFLSGVTPPPSQTGGGTDRPPGALEPHVYGGYRDLRNSLAKHLPTQLERSRKTNLVTLRLLGKRHKVRH